MQVETLAKNFIFLANKPVLTKSEHEESKKLMIELKKAGMSNAEISELSGNRWSIPTVKGYTTGVKTSSPNPWQDAVSLLNNFISEDMELDTVKEALGTLEYLETHNVSLEDVVGFLQIADSASIELATITQMMEELQQSGLSPDKVNEVIELKNKIEAKGLSFESLPTLAELAGTFGVTQEVLAAISEYGSLGELNAKVNTTQEVLAKLGAEIDSGNTLIHETQAKLSEMSKPLQAYHQVSELGFGEQELVAIAGLASQYDGPKAVLQAVHAYADYQHIQSDTAKATSQLNNLKLAIVELDTTHSHLTTAIAMCDKLMGEYQLGIDAIATIFSLAEKYGQPVAVLKGVETFVGLQELQEEMATLQGKVTETKKLLAQLEGKYEQGLHHLESLAATAINVGKDIADLEYKIENNKELTKVLNLISNPSSADYGVYGPVVCAIAASLLKWVASHQKKFSHLYSINEGLKHLISNLGGS